MEKSSRKHPAVCGLGEEGPPHAVIGESHMPFADVALKANVAEIP